MSVWIVLCLAAQLSPILCDPMDCSPPGSSAHGDSPGQNTRVDCHFLLQGIFTTQGLNPSLSHCRQILDHLSHQGSPTMDYRTLTPGWLGCEEEYLQVTVMAKSYKIFK